MRIWADCTDRTDAWIKKVIQDNPAKVLPNGNIRSCPVRLSFPNLIELDDNGKYSVTALFHPFGNDSVDLFRKVADEQNKAKWPNIPAKQLFVPFHDGGEKSFAGYEESVTFFGSTADKQHKPALWGANRVPIVNEDAVYPGVWAIITYRPYTFQYIPEGAKNVVKKGAGFGLSSVMIIADDQKLGGSFSNPEEDFEGVNVDPADHQAALDMLS